MDTWRGFYDHFRLFWRWGAKGDKGDKGDTGTIAITTGIAGEAINAYRLVTTNSAGMVVVASSDDSTHIGRV